MGASVESVRASNVLGAACGNRLSTCMHAYRAVTQSIKDVLQSLVDDNLVDLEKIGIQNFYWSFPSKEMVKVRPVGGRGGWRCQHIPCPCLQLTAKKEEAQAKLDAELAQAATLTTASAALAAERTEGVRGANHRACDWPSPNTPTLQEARTAKLEELGALRAKKRRLLEQLEEQKANDPATIKALTDDVARSKEAANRWVGK